VICFLKVLLWLALGRFEIKKTLGFLALVDGRFGALSLSVFWLSF
jgi:hypothetical protein